MRASIKLIKFVTLELTDDEATWLSTIMQNPFTAEESPRDSNFRQLFWNVLNPPDRENK